MRLEKINFDNFMPDYTIDKEMMHLVSDIDELLKQVNITEDMSIIPQPYKRHRKYCDDIEEVNAPIKKAYALIKDFDCLSKENIKKLHSLLLGSDKIINFRDEPVFVYNTQNLKKITMLDSNDIDRALTKLINWYKSCDDNILIKTIAFCRSFIFIHPFLDGNGRTCRFIFTSLWSKYNEKLVYFSIEQMLNDYVINDQFKKMNMILIMTLVNQLYFIF